MPINRNKVFVGLSGGVDSSVSAALLQARGFDVTGVFIKGWYPDWQECNWREDRRDAMRVCAHLNIPFLTLDLEREYKREVVDYMIREYKAGRTPNPDVMCNKEIKFGAFLKFAKSKGASYVATGHYTQIEPQAPIFNNQFSKKRNRFKNYKIGPSLKIENWELKISKDSNKDQSYFLWTLTQKQLKHILFPVGHLKKPQVRTLAKKYGLPTAEKRDSQGLCFIGKVDMKDFLSHYIKPQKGLVIDEQGKIIGKHNGAIFLTIGQRHGFEIHNKAEKSAPHYVVAKDIKKNTVTVSSKNIENSNQYLQIPLEQTNWITGEPSYDTRLTNSRGQTRQNESFGQVSYDVRLRYRQKLLKAKVKKEKSNWIVVLDKPTKDISSGQSLVIYSKDTIVGGGVIK